MNQQKRPTGMVGFSIVWIGQIVSVMASSMTAFGMTIWIYQKTESVTALALMQVFFITPFLLMSPIAGVMVDRYNRKLMMMVSDLAAGIGTVGILILFALGKLEVWHLYVSAVLLGIGNTFQWPAYSAAISTMVPKEQYGRANGMMSLIEAGPGVVAPLLAGALLPFIGLTGIMLIDMVTFVFAIGTLLIVFIPQPSRTEEGRQGQGSVWKEAAYGFQYIFARPSLLGLQMVFFFGNLFATIGFTLLAPMILARTGQNTLALGSVESAGAVGGVIGGIVMSAWGGFKRKVHGVLLGWIFSSLFGMVLLGIGQSVPVWIAALGIAYLFIPLVNGSNQAIWQAKVAPDVQGRVFSARRLIAWFTNPIAPLIAGTLADFWLEPAMRTQNGFSNLFGRLVGTGPGSGMGLLLILCGIGGALVGLSGYFIPAIRNAETLLPDHDTLAPAEPQPAPE
jgi:DHA3 family macrolide efflux protein-like MFS transporter